jgi:hypothetical protein
VIGQMASLQLITGLHWETHTPPVWAPGTYSSIIPKTLVTSV